MLCLQVGCAPTAPKITTKLVDLELVEDFLDQHLLHGMGSHGGLADFDPQFPGSPASKGCYCRVLGSIAGGLCL